MAVSRRPVLERGTQAFVDALEAHAGTPLYELSYADARQVLEDAQAINVRNLPADVEEKTLPTGPTGEVSVRIYRPRGSQSTLPVVMYFHGGGWILGSSRTHDRLLRDLVNGVDAAFVFVNYTRSPEAQFPTSIEQAYAATNYVVEHAADFRVDPNRLAVVGDSVGGNMTAAVTLLAKERNGPAIRYQVMMYPVTGVDFENGSYGKFANGPWLTRAAMQWFWDTYAPNAEDRKEPTASPVTAPLELLKGLPAALLLVDENDVLRDEGEAYARRLMEAGVDVTAMRVLGTIHDFAMLNALADTPATRATIQIVSGKLKEALLIVSSADRSAIA